MAFATASVMFRTRRAAHISIRQHSTVRVLLPIILAISFEV